MLVFPPELRAQALARLGPPTWPTPRPRVVEPAVPRLRVVKPPPAPAPAPSPAREPFVRSVAVVFAARVAQLGLIFVAVTLITLAMSLVAQAVR